MTTHVPAGRTGPVKGLVHLADGTTETVEELSGWADAFEGDDRPSPLTPPRPGRPNLGRRRGHPSTDPGESPRITIRVPTDLLIRIDDAAASSAVTRAEFVREAVERLLFSSEMAWDLADTKHYLDILRLNPLHQLEYRTAREEGASWQK